jgi:hypothetical protein
MHKEGKRVNCSTSGCAVEAVHTVPLNPAPRSPVQVSRLASRGFFAIRRKSGSDLSISPVQEVRAAEVRQGAIPVLL